MSLLLDALKKSEAQRRRGSSPTIDLTSTPPSGSPRRWRPHRVAVVLVVVLLVAAAPWLLPQVPGWMEAPRDAAGQAEAGAGAPPGAEPDSASGESPVARAAARSVPGPVAGASSTRRVAAAEATAGPAPDERREAGSDRSGRSAKSGADSNADTGVVADAGSPANDAGPEAGTASAAAGDPDAAAEARAAIEAARRNAPEQAQRPDRQQPATSQPAEAPDAAPERPDNKPAENFIRPWELPQAQRAEFPQLRLTVHFYSENASSRFVLINGERYREGQRVGPGTRLAEIRQRGAVVEFGSYRVLIE